MYPNTIILSGFLLAWILFWYILSRLLQRMDVADVAWGLGVASLALISLGLSEAAASHQLILSGAAIVWGVRLAWHIHSRSRGRGEDARYRAWREAWGRHVHVRSFFQVFVLQTVLMAVVSLPVLLLNLGSFHTEADPNSAGFAVGTLLFLFGFLFESIADWQLSRFLADTSNTGRVMRVGLWSRTRHPNYFGEVVLWWGMGIMSFSAGAPVVVMVSPLLVTFLIVKVSGIPMLEEKMSGDPKYADYIADTNVFWPL